MARLVTPTAFGTTGTRIRAEHDGRILADSRNAVLLRESPAQLTYGFPQADIAEGALERSEKTRRSKRRGEQIFWHIGAGESREENAAFAFTEVPDGRPDLRGYVFIDFRALDAWYEEEEELIGHPRDPFTRIDVRRSSAHVEVKADGVTVATSFRPMVLVETGLSTRYYIPNDDVSWKYLELSQATTECPYKGRSKYWSVRVGDTVHEDVAWAYPEPLQDAQPVSETVCFQQEKLEVYVDGERQETPPKFFTK